MRERAIAVAIGLLTLVGANGVQATTLPDCCACLPTGGATTSGGGPPETIALFCAEAERGNTMELADRCDQQPGYQLVCLANIPGPSCVQQLAEEGILCPAAGAPAAGPLTLATLAATLAAAGALLLHYRRRA